MNPLSDFIHKRAQEYQAPAAMTHVVYGYPSIQESLDWMRALLTQGVDILEVQFPFSDPVADGPTIVSACHKALESQPNMAQCLRDIEEFSQTFSSSKILLMSYLNPVYRFGVTKLVKAAAQAGIHGLILPDLPIEQAREYKAACQKNGIDPVWLVTPATPSKRIAMIAQQATGMLYCVSRSGVTGQKESESITHKKTTGKCSLEDYLASIRQHTLSEDKNVPLAVGFGIRTPEQVSDLTDLAEVAIIGSALLEAYNTGKGQTGKEKAGLELVRSLFPYLKQT